MAVIQPRPTHIIYQCAKFGDDWTSSNVIFDVCMAYTHILIFYFSAIRRDIDLKFIQDTNRVVINSLKKMVFHRSKVDVTGTVNCFLKVQSYHKN